MPMQDRPDRHDVDIRFGNGRFYECETIKLFDDRLQVLAAPRYAESRKLDRPAWRGPNCCARR